MTADWPDPVEIGDSSASHAALSWPALRFALVNRAEVRVLANERIARSLRGEGPLGQLGGIDRRR